MNTPDIFETKLTRTEVLNLILDDLTAEIEAQREPLRVALEKVPGPDIADFIPHLAKAVEAGKAEIDLSSDYRQSGETRIRLTFHLPDAKLPKPHLAAEAERNRLVEQIDELNSQLNKLTTNRRKAQNEIIRRSLQGSAGGKLVLEAISGFKLALKRKLLPESKA